LLKNDVLMLFISVTFFFMNKQHTKNSVNTALLAALTPITSRVRTDVTAKRSATGAALWTTESLTDEMLLKHLNGGPARGCSFIRPGENTTLIAALDLDSHQGELTWDEMRVTALRIADHLSAKGYPTTAWRSSGGKGIHLYYIWDTPQDAYSVRSMLQGALGELGFTDGAGGVAKGEVEVFPKQNAVAPGAHGNMMWLILTGESVPLENMADFWPGTKESALEMQWNVCPDVPVLTAPVVTQSGAGVTVGSETLLSALAAIPNDGEGLSYESWRDVIFAIHHATKGSTEGLKLAHSFSQRSAKYDAAFLDQRTWRYIKDREQSITVRTIIALAETHGWRDPSETFSPITATLGPQFKRFKNGDIPCTTENALAAVKDPAWLGLSIGFDTFTEKLMYCPYPAKSDAKWKAWADTDTTLLQARLESKGFRLAGRETVKNARDKAAQENQFDSAQVWLDGLKWDGTPRVDVFLSQYLKAEDCKYSTAVSRYIWTALAARVIKPGYQVDMMPIMVGDQGIRKSTAIRNMVPDHALFCEISFTENENDLSRRMKGVLIAEVAELSGLKTRDAEMIKRWITKTHEHWVPKFQEFTVSYPRRLLLVGTTNERDFLSDPTGNRRFLPFDVGLIDTIAIEKDCEQFWAEGRELFLQHGFDYFTPENMAKNEHEKYSFEDEWIDIVKDYLSKSDPMTGKPRDSQGHFLRGIEVLRDAIGIEIKFQQRRDLLRIGRILRELGYIRKNLLIGDKQIKAYSKNDGS